MLDVFVFIVAFMTSSMAGEICDKMVLTDLWIYRVDLRIFDDGTPLLSGLWSFSWTEAEVFNGNDVLA